MSSTSNAAGAGAPLPETEALLNRVAGMISGARALPLSSSVKLDNKDEILELLREASERLPEEVRQGRWMLKEREEFLAATKRQADELVEAARSEAQRLVQRTEILKEAQAQARRVVEEARDEARRLRLEAEDYADQKLAHFEIVLERTLKTVASGRQKLSGITDKDDDPSGPVTALEATPPGRGKAAPGGPDKRRTGNRHPARPATSPGAAAGAGVTFAGANLAGGGPVGERPPVRVSSGNAIGGPRFAGRGPTTAATPAPAASPSNSHAEQAEGPDESFFDQDLLG
ncbi:MAG: DivIVA domain-containing protein [Acidimicrobiales bacterium]